MSSFRFKIAMKAECGCTSGHRNAERGASEVREGLTAAAVGILERP
jgi:hypothetical protein